MTRPSGLLFGVELDVQPTGLHQEPFAWPVTELDCQLAREYEAFKAMWHIAIEENTRKELLSVWNLGWEPRTCGLWHEFLLVVAGYGGQLGQGGSIIFERQEVELHLNTPAVVFRHQVRSLQRVHLLAQAKEAVPGTYDMAPAAVDWTRLDEESLAVQLEPR